MAGRIYSSIESLKDTVNHSCDIKSCILHSNGSRQYCIIDYQNFIHTNGDARIDATDSRKILSLYSTLSTTSDYELTDEEKKAMDVNLDGNVDASDALRCYPTILMFQQAAQRILRNS